MAVTKCISSHLMTELLTWRNPQGSEENWLGQRQGIDSLWRHIGKVVSTEIGLFLLATTAAVETVAYSTLALVSLAFYSMTDVPCKFFAKALESSSFTVIWALADAILFNPFEVNIGTQESYARFWTEGYNTTAWVLYREGDKEVSADLAENKRRSGSFGEVESNGPPSPLLAEAWATEEAISLGAAFLIENVLADLPLKHLALLREGDYSFLRFVLTKSVYIYAFGAKKTEEIPPFFKSTTGPQIVKLREALNDEMALRELERLTANPIQFETEPATEEAIVAFRELKNIGANELSGSLLATKCCLKAANSLPITTEELES